MQGSPLLEAVPPRVHWIARLACAAVERASPRAFRRRAAIFFLATFSAHADGERRGAEMDREGGVGKGRRVGRAVRYP